MKTTNYGPCPICSGRGEIPSPHTSSMMSQCHYCKGAKTVVFSVTETTPVWPMDWPQYPSKTVGNTGKWDDGIALDPSGRSRC